MDVDDESQPAMVPYYWRANKDEPWTMSPADLGAPTDPRPGIEKLLFGDPKPTALLFDDGKGKLAMVQTSSNDWPWYEKAFYPDKRLEDLITDPVVTL